jgi:hypothetical protein
MKTAFLSLLVVTALSGATVSFGSGDSSGKATVTVEYLDPEKFTDFKTTRMGGNTDTEYLSRELRQEINRQAGRILPAGYRVLMRIHDVDLAGDFEPQLRPPFDDIRIMRSVYIPRMKIEFSVTDAAGNVVASGERTLSDMSYEFRLRPTPQNRTLEVESEMIGDFFREIRRAAAA